MTLRARHAAAHHRAGDETAIVSSARMLPSFVSERIARRRFGLER